MHPINKTALIPPPFAAEPISRANSGRSFFSDKESRRTKFEAAWTTIRTELVLHLAAQGMPEDAISWYRRNLDYNVPGGKLNRGMSVVDSVELIKSRPLDDTEYFKAAVLGWCVELLQAYFLVADDIMDQSFTRRSQPCWFRVEGVGNVAINDSFMLEAAIYHLLKSHFREEKYYVDLLELFLETTHQTEMGQLVDLITAPEDNVDLGKFSLERHRLIVIYKTAFYSFYLPVALAMYMCDIPSAYPSPTNASETVRPFELAKSILLPLGEYFQVQDDWLDYSGTPEQIGKVGTDIIDNKCSWCVNAVLAVASPEQRAVLDANYGKKEKGCEGKVKEVYAAVGLAEKYKTYEEGAYRKILGLIDSIPEPAGGRKEGDAPIITKEVFRTFLDKIYKRTK